MIDILFEQRLIQNSALAAEVIWQSTQEAFDASSRTQGVILPLCFIVLPMAFHRRTAIALASKTQPGAMYKALSDDREIVVGLQGRMQAMSARTLEALSIAFQSGLLRWDRVGTFQLFPGRKTQPVVHATDEVKTIMNAAKRIGQAFSEMTLVQISTQLGIKF